MGNNKCAIVTVPSASASQMRQSHSVCTKSVNYETR